MSECRGRRPKVNGLEFFIHHEDVRRANGWDRRTDRPDLEPVAWRIMDFTGRRITRQIRPYGLELRRPEGDRRRFGPLDGAVLSGGPTELLLYLTGRRDTAHVNLDGNTDAVCEVHALGSNLRMREPVWPSPKGSPLPPHQGIT
jgi:hypothetical protein